MTADPADAAWMARAIRLAARGRGFVSPNPLVGAVLVKQGHLISEGYHRRYGEAHAEVNALRRAKQSVAGATLYVNLEPCCHWGHTPPCSEAVSGFRARPKTTTPTSPESRSQTSALVVPGHYAATAF